MPYIWCLRRPLKELGPHASGASFLPGDSGTGPSDCPLSDETFRSTPSIVQTHLPLMSLLRNLTCHLLPVPSSGNRAISPSHLLPEALLDSLSSSH